MMERIPAPPPIGGALWTVVIPAALFIFTLLSTIALYRKFARTEK